MSTHKNIDRICCIVLVLTLLVTVLLMGGTLGLQASAKTLGYETRLFDNTKVHTIDIEMDDWDSFIESCEDEEYTTCNAVIDGETYKDIAIRAKGNTSLSSVSQLGSSRYSFKIEFDHFDEDKTYHGLDKLSLNNLIQDNTMMKDYLVYTMMNEYGVNAPLCSFVFITVNGEDWGLYLAVEGIEDSFLERNFNNSKANLYKPDSQSNGGGRGNGKDFNMEEFQNQTIDLSGIGLTDEDLEILGLQDADLTAVPMADLDFDKFSELDTSHLDLSGLNIPGLDNNQEGNQSGDMPQMPSDFAAGGETPPEMPENAGQDGKTPPEMPETTSGSEASDTSSEETADAAAPTNAGGKMQKQGNMGGFGGMGSDDVKLQYIDDDPDSYSNIFGNAKTDISDKDEERLIASLKSLSSYEDIEDVVNVDEVLRYFVVHNFVVNGDSYTGSMIHNYYLYEDDGQLSMIPWDYNLAFGGFQGNDASSVVNDPIDDVLDDRPMQAWIFSDESYTEMYHEYFQDFLDTVDPISIIDNAYNLIKDYVDRDPTKFCTTEEFEIGVQTLRSFCTLRTESVQGQLDGTIPSTTDGQNADSSTLIDASSITISDMGSMNQGGGMGHGNNTDGGFSPFDKSAETSESSTEEASDNATSTEDTAASAEASQTGERSNNPPTAPPDMPTGQTPPDMPSGMTPPGEKSESESTSS